MNDIAEVAKTLGLPAAFSIALLLMLGGLMLSLVKIHNRFLVSLANTFNKIAEAVSEMQKSLDSNQRKIEVAVNQRDSQHQIVMAKLEELRRVVIQSYRTMREEE